MKNVPLMHLLSYMIVQYFNGISNESPPKKVMQTRKKLWPNFSPEQNGIFHRQNKVLARVAFGFLTTTFTSTDLSPRPLALLPSYYVRFICTYIRFRKIIPVPEFCWLSNVLFLWSGRESTYSAVCRSEKPTVPNLFPGHPSAMCHACCSTRWTADRRAGAQGTFEPPSQSSRCFVLAFVGWVGNGECTSASRPSFHNVTWTGFAVPEYFLSRSRVFACCWRKLPWSGLADLLALCWRAILPNAGVRKFGRGMESTGPLATSVISPDFVDLLAASGLVLERRRESVLSGADASGAGVLGFVHCFSCPFTIEVSGSMSAAHVIEQHQVMSPDCDEGQDDSEMVVGSGDRRDLDVGSDIGGMEDISESMDDNGVGSSGSYSDCSSVCDSEFSLLITGNISKVEFESVAARWQSFDSVTWPSDSNMDGEVMASAGFFFNINSQMFQCWSCGLQLPCADVWQNDLLYPFHKHFDLEPNCSHLQSLRTGPAFVMTTHGDAARDCHEHHDLKHSETARQTTFSTYNSQAEARTAAVWHSSLAVDGFYYTGWADVVRCAFCRLTIGPELWLKEQVIRRYHLLSSPFCELVQDQASSSYSTDTQSLREANVESGMEREAARFASFCNWPKHLHGAGTSVGEMAADGFFYPGVGDQVTCFACQVSVRHCPSGRSAAERHSSQIPLCPRLTARDTGNVALEVPAISGVERLQNSQARCETFLSWPAQVPISGEELADAGFFYLGVGDVVRCVFCSLEVRHWSSGQFAWRKHKSKSPNCSHVRQNCPKNIERYVSILIGRKGKKLTNSEVKQLSSHTHVDISFIKPDQPSRPRTESCYSRPASGDVLSSVHSGVQPVQSMPGVQQPQFPGVYQQMSNPFNPMPAQRFRPGMSQPAWPQPHSLPWSQPPRANAKCQPSRPVSVCVGCKCTEISCFLLPCEHLSCSACSQKHQKCPQCKKPVLSVIRMLSLKF